MNSPQLTQFDGELLDGLQFCSKVYALFQEIRNLDDGPSRLRMRTSVVEKKLVEELLPICKYVQSKYRAGRYISIRWFGGSQQFDAEVVQTGAYVEHGYFPRTAHLEVTCVMHPSDYLSRELLDKTGSAFGLDGLRRLRSGEIDSEPVSYLNQEFVQLYSKLVVKQIEKKAGITYPLETTLIVQCSLNTLYMPEEWEALVKEVRNQPPKHRFREVFMYDMTSEYFCSLWGEL